MAALSSTNNPVLNGLRKTGFGLCEALWKICSSALESFDVVC